MKSRLIALAFIIAVVFPAAATAAVTIGNGFTCDGSTIMKGTKTIPYSKAKSNVEKTIENLKEKLGDAPKNKKAGIKEKIKLAKESKTLLKACSSGTLSPDQVDPIFTQLASGSGTYSGTYNATVDIVGPISGDMSFVFTLNGTVFSATVTFTGPLASALEGQSLGFSNDVGGIGFPALFNLPDTFLGSVTLEASQNGNLKVTNSGSSKGTINFNGNFAGSTVNGNLTGSYDSKSFLGTLGFTGSFLLNKQ